MSRYEDAARTSHVKEPQEHVVAYSVSTTIRPSLVDFTVYTVSCSCGWLEQREGTVRAGQPVPPPGYDGRAHGLAHLARVQSAELQCGGS